MAGLAQSEIDDLCENYEEFRTPENCGPSSIRQFLQDSNLHQNIHPLLMPELVQIDMQLNWMRWEKNLSKLQAAADPLTVRQALLQIPRIADYAWFNLQKPSPQELDALRQIAECELESRKRWGDAIGPPYYRATYGVLLSQDQGYPGVYLRFSSEESHRFREITPLTLRGKTIFGRQRSTDPDQLFEEELADGNRIVIADKADSSISREQLAVEVLSRTYAIVTNLSNINAVVIEGAGSLHPSDSLVLPFDFSIRLPGRRLFFVASRK